LQFFLVYVLDQTDKLSVSFWLQIIYRIVSYRIVSNPCYANPWRTHLYVGVATCKLNHRMYSDLVCKKFLLGMCEKVNLRNDKRKRVTD